MSGTAYHRRVTVMSAGDLQEVETFLAAIDGNDDVQNMYVGLAN